MTITKKEASIEGKDIPASASKGITKKGIIRN